MNYVIKYQIIPKQKNVVISGQLDSHMPVFIKFNIIYMVLFPTLQHISYVLNQSQTHGQ